MSRDKKKRTGGAERLSPGKAKKEAKALKPVRRDANPELKKLYRDRWLARNKKVKSVYQRFVDEQDGEEDQVQLSGRSAPAASSNTPRSSRVLQNLQRLQAGKEMLKPQANVAEVEAKPQTKAQPAQPELVVEPPFPGAEKDQRLMSILKRMQQGRKVDEAELEYFDQVMAKHEDEIDWLEDEGEDDLWDAFERSGRGPKA
ncbi:hypothetical protein [Balneatrix alpica]|uniref:Der GTPase-activating protein YihI n=1 Tax=Balneatrix alpica TaxID=75684 RepID=A0ABV5Z6V2_9GAMM|nr:hypothetical protein [Balneatrix alpica]